MGRAGTAWPRRNSGYQLRVSSDQLDSLRFERMVTAAQEVLASDSELCASTLGEALGLWRGRALEGFEEQPFARAECVRLEELRLCALEDLAEAELALGRHAGVAGRLQSLVVEHPTRERVTAQLMRALCYGGRQAEALQAYQVLRAQLRDELGIDPSPQLRDLERAVLRQELQEPSRARGTDRASEMRHDGNRDTGLPQALPPGRTPFVGRTAERRTLTTLMRLAAASEGALVMIGGEPGVGKTRLCEEITLEARQRGFRTFTGHCYEAQADLPYMPWVEMIETLAREVSAEALREALGEEASRVRTAGSTTAAIFPTHLRLWSSPRTNSAVTPSPPFVSTNARTHARAAPVRARGPALG